jgi:hypothetical protein
VGVGVAPGTGVGVGAGVGATHAAPWELLPAFAGGVALATLALSIVMMSSAAPPSDRVRIFMAWPPSC